MLEAFISYRTLAKQKKLHYVQICLSCGYGILWGAPRRQNYKAEVRRFWSVEGQQPQNIEFDSRPNLKPASHTHGERSVRYPNGTSI